MLGIDHVSYLVRDMARAVRFYEGVLGLHEVGATPDRSFVALSWGENVHDIALMTGRPTIGGSVHHVAITLQGGPDELRRVRGCAARPGCGARDGARPPGQPVDLLS